MYRNNNNSNNNTYDFYYFAASEGDLRGTTTFFLKGAQAFRRNMQKGTSTVCTRDYMAVKAAKKMLQ